jgi:hypothetical protein
MELCEPKAKGFELLVGCNFVARENSLKIFTVSGASQLEISLKF